MSDNGAVILTIIQQTEAARPKPHHPQGTPAPSQPEPPASQPPPMPEVYDPVNGPAWWKPQE